jgi:hypothetical protein
MQATVSIKWIIIDSSNNVAMPRKLLQQVEDEGQRLCDRPLIGLPHRTTCFSHTPTRCAKHRARPQLFFSTKHQGDSDCRPPLATQQHSAFLSDVGVGPFG